LVTITQVSPGKPSDRLLLYRNGPRKLLNRLSEEKKRQYLFRRLHVEFPSVSSLSIPQDLARVQNLAFIWPKDLAHAYCAFPIVTSLKRAWQDCQAFHLVPPLFEPFIRTAFPNDRILALDFQELRLDETGPHVLSSNLLDFKAEAIFLLDHSPSPWHWVSLSLSQAKIRCALSQEVPFPHANLRIAGVAGEPLFTRAQRLEPLLKGCGVFSQGFAWARLQPSAQSTEEALKALNKARVNPGNLWALLSSGGFQGVDQDAIQTLRRREGSIELISLQHEEGSSPNPQPISIDASVSPTRITTHSLSQLLGLTAWLKGAFGQPNDLLYLLSLTDLEIRTWLSTFYSDLDLSAFNPRFKLLPTQTQS
jgi:hypothetical protein